MLRSAPEDDHIVIIDAGSGIRRLGNRLLAEKRHDYTMIFTHAHWDHIMGFPFFKPIYRSDTRIALFGCPFAQASVREMISRIMAPPNFPVNFEDITADIRYQEACQETFQLGGHDHHPHSDQPPQPGDGIPFRGRGEILRLSDRQRADLPASGRPGIRGLLRLRERGGPPRPRRRIPSPRITV